MSVITGRPAIDYSGQQFGYYTVLHRISDREKEIKRKSAIWVCECICGNKVEIYSSKLKNSKSCGCKIAEDLIGNTYGRLTVLERAENSKSNKTRWLCLCDCGKKKTILGAQLKNGRTVSCGCFRKEKISSLYFEDLTGETFGRWTVISRSENKNNNTKWLCECQCGKIKKVIACHLKSGKSISCGCNRVEMLMSWTHENHPNWKGNCQLKFHLRRKIIEWKKESMKSCNYKCVITGENFNDIHHLYPFYKIVDKVLEELNVNIREKIDDYTQEELTLIENKCLVEHFKHPLGVCLTEELHREFHLKYGLLDFTPDDFQEFFHLKTNKRFDLERGVI